MAVLPMIRYTQGNLLDAQAEALVNTVNEVGVMGKGIALMFRETFPENARVYEAAAKRGEVHVGRMLVTANSVQIGPRGGPRWIIHFPTKKHWRDPSRMEWIRDGLHDLVRAVRENHITSIAVPPLGCGAGGLEWSQVRREIDGAMAELEDVDVLVFEPTAAHVDTEARGSREGAVVKYLVVIEKGRRSWGADVPDLPGCVAAAKTRAAVAKLIKEAIEFHIEGLRAAGMRVPRRHSEGEVVSVRVA